jgi:hypothetical protein
MGVVERPPLFPQKGLIMVGLMLGLVFIVITATCIGALWPIAMDNSKRDKIRRLESEKLQLQEDKIVLFRTIDKLNAELAAYQYQLPWVKVEELDGTQE